MNPRRLLLRKMIYVGLMIPLVLLLAVLGMPAAPGAKGAPGSPGGVLARLREQHELSPTTLGDIDPTSETLKLATMGLRGVASTILWEKANNYKAKKDWTNLAATLEQLSKFQPNFVSVWRFQSWNLSYNVSVEFDDYRDRYHWVIRGLNYLDKGIRYNRNEAILVWDSAYFVQHKIGRSDERVQFRRLFKQDDDFHGSRPMARRDSWLVAKERFEDCLDVVDRGGRMRGSPLLYRSNPTMAQMGYAEAIEKEGTFGEVARREWKQAGDEWHAFGSIDLPRTGTDVTMRLNDYEPRQEQRKALLAELDALDPGLRERLRQEKLAALTDEQRKALETPPENRSTRQMDMAAQAEASIKVEHNEQARRIRGENRRKALDLAKQIDVIDDELHSLRSSRGIVNFEYWRLRAAFEQEAETVDAREAIYRGQQALAETDLVAAKRLYEAGLLKWRQVLDRHPRLLGEENTRSITVDDLGEVIDEYRRLLKLLDEPFPEQFVLKDVLDYQQANQ